MVAGVALVLTSCTGGGHSGVGHAGSASSSTTTSCPADGRTRVEDGVRVRVFCGPARARVTIGDHTLAFSDGRCSRHRAWVELTLGSVVIAPNRPRALLQPKRRTFSLVVGADPLVASDATPAPDDGTYDEGVISFAVPGRGYVVDDPTVVLIGSRTGGAFTGTIRTGDQHDAANGTKVRGLFSCDTHALTLDAVDQRVQGTTTTGQNGSTTATTA